MAAFEPMTLEAYYAAALQRSEVVASQGELIVQAEERARQAVATMLPGVNGVGTFNRYDAGTTPSPPVTVPPTPTSPLETRTHITKLTVTQSITRGFREFAMVRQSRALRGAQADDYHNARVLLYKDVVQNFYTVLSIEQDLRNYNEEINQNLERERDIQARVRIGRSRPSEVLNVQATISTLRAQVEQMQGQLRVARESFAFLSGRDTTTPLLETRQAPSLEPLDVYLARAETRPDVQASQKRLTAAREGTTVAERAHLPSLELSGNYYLYRDDLYDSKWDTQLVLTVPLYAGGATESKRREAVSLRVQSELAVSQVRRQAEQEIRALYESVTFDLTQVAALEHATEAARKSYEAQVRDYRLGLVTNLEVLQALTTYQQNQRALDRARYTTQADYQRLLVASARRPEPTTP